MATFLRRDDYARDSIDLLICGRISEWDPLGNHLGFKESQRSHAEDNFQIAGSFNAQGPLLIELSLKNWPFLPDLSHQTLALVTILNSVGIDSFLRMNLCFPQFLLHRL